MPKAESSRRGFQREVLGQVWEATLSGSGGEVGIVSESRGDIFYDLWERGRCRQEWLH